MRVNQAIDKLKNWAKNYIENDNDVILLFSGKIRIGKGSTEHENQTDPYKITIGIKPYKETIPMNYQQITKSNFTKIGITVFHELTHYAQSTSNNTPKEILISDLSKFNNPQYYRKCWNTFPHEIDAENSGVMTMRSKLESEFGTQANDFILEYLEHRSGETLYMFHESELQSCSKNHVNDLFEIAYDQSLTNKRSLPHGFLRYQDEVAQLLTDKDHNLRPEYVPIFNKLIITENGAELDLRMASLVSYLHPELQDMYPQLDFKELHPSSVMGITMPETSEEIKARILPIDNSILFSTNEYPVQLDEDKEFENVVNAISVDQSVQL